MLSALEEISLSEIVNGAFDGIVAIDERGIILSFNSSAVALFGYSEDEVIGRNVRLLMPEPFRSEHDGYIKNYLCTGEAKVIGVGRVVEGERKDGSVFPMEIRITATHAQDKRVFVGFMHDLTERRKFETRMQEMHSERLNSIEEMAVGLAHELKQPLTATNTYLGVARRLVSMHDLQELEKIIDNAARQVFRASEIIDNLREFLARGDTVKTRQSLNEIIRTACVNS